MQGQSIHLLDINCMTETTSFFVVTHDVKQSTPGPKQPVMKLEAYSMNSYVLLHYLRRTLVGLLL